MRLPLRRPRLLPLLALATVALPLVAGLLASAQAGGREPRLTPRERARVELGRRLFFDPVVSRSGARACAACHDPEHGYSDRERRSRDDVGLTRRHSQTLLDVAQNPSAHWDGEFESLEALITARLKPVSNGKGLASHGAALGGAGAERGDPRPLPPVPEKKAERPYDPPGEREPAGEPAAPAEPTPGEPGYRAPAGSEPPPAAGEPPAEPAPPAPPGAAPPPPPAAPAAPPAAPPATPPAPPDAVDPRTPPPESDPFAVAGEDLPLDVRRLPRVDLTLEHADRYREAFQAAYGSPDVNVDRIAGAVAAYCRTLASGTSAYDRFLAGDAQALDAEQQAGLALFQGRARCAECHLTTPGPDGRAPFTDYAFHDTGIALRELAADPWRQTRRGPVLGADAGREGVSTRPQDRRAFKTPSLRDVARRGPFFHDGGSRTLEEAVAYYAQAGSGDPDASARVHGIALGEVEVRRLVAFLHALSSDERPGLAAEAWRVRAARTTLLFVDGVGRRMAGLEVRLEPTGDVLPGWTPAQDAPLLLVTDAKGEVAFAPGGRTHVRLRLPDALPPAGGDLVPDTCRAARIEVPVDGRLRLALHLPSTRVLPDVIAAEHVGLMRLPGHPAPRTLLTRVGVVAAADGLLLAQYAGWRRTDVPATARLLLPVARGKPPQRVAADLSGNGTLVEVPAP